MKPKTTIILLVLALLIGGFVWYDHTHLQDTDKVTEQAKRVFPNLKSGDVTKLELHNTNGVIAVEKAGDKWDMKQPYQVRANKSMVDAVLSDLEFLDAERAMAAKDLKEANATLAGYGLEKPRIEATLTVGGKPQTIKIGDESKVGGNVYAAITGSDKVFVIPKRMADTLSKGVDDMRDRSLIEIQAAQLNKVELKAGNRQIEMTKIENTADSTEGWRITRPINARADKTKIDDIGNKLADLKVETFVTEEPKDLKMYGLDDPTQEVTLFTKGSEGAKIVQFGSALTNEPTRVYAKRKANNSIFTVKNDILTNLLVQVNDVRDRSLAEFEADQVKGVDFTVGTQVVKLTRGTNEWSIAEPAKFKAEQSACDDLVHHIRDAEIKEFAADVITDLAQYGLDKPGCQVVLKKENVGGVASTNEPPKAAASTNAVAATETKATEWLPLLTIQIGKADPAKGIVYVKRADEPFVYGLGTNFLAELPKGVLDLRDRTILETEVSSIRKLEVTRGSSQFVTEQVAIKGTNNVETKEWKLLAPAHGVLDASAVEDAASSLAHIKAESLVAENPSNLGQFGLEPPAAVISFTSTTGTNAPAQTHVLLIGNESPAKRRLAMLKGNPLVFELDETTGEHLMKDFLTKPEAAPVTATNQPPTITVTNAPAAK